MSQQAEFAFAPLRSQPEFTINPPPAQQYQKVVVPPQQGGMMNGREAGMGLGFFGALLLWFIIFLVLFWLIFYSLRPGFVMNPGTNEINLARVLLFAVIAALVLLLIIWLIRALASRRC